MSENMINSFAEETKSLEPFILDKSFHFSSAPNINNEYLRSGF